MQEHDTHAAADSVIGMLSIAGLEHGVPRVSAYDLLEQINKVHQEFPSLVPHIPSRDLWMKFLYYDLVKVGEGVHFPLDKDQWTIHLTADIARRNLALIAKRRGDEFVKALGMAAQVFAQLFKPPSDPPPATD